tara:strand:+ start:77 stop:1048 length:972 start_codon:yes stop_codon:yes gene_type:complete
MDNNCDLEHMKKAGEIHLKVEKYIKDTIKPNIKLYDLAVNIENKIKEECDLLNIKNSGIAFPTGLSINNCAAHWTPKMNCNRILTNKDLIKIDFGVHIEGSIIDSAFSFSFDDKYNNLIEASNSSTLLAIKLMRPDMLLNEIGKEIEENMKSYEIQLDNKLYEINPVNDLCGHQIKQYKIHAGKVIPNIYVKEYNERVKEDEFYAVETFATTGNGLTYVDNNDCSHYMIDYNKKSIVKGSIKDFYKLIYNHFNTLAFCDRWLIGKELKKEKLNQKKIDKCLLQLKNNTIINSYPPIYDINENNYISQYENSIYVNENNTIILG